MAKEYRIHIRGDQREAIDADLMARLVIMMGRQLATGERRTVDAQDADGLVAEAEARAARQQGEAAS
jgi:hypothetical protein